MWLYAKCTCVTNNSVVTTCSVIRCGCTQNACVTNNSVVTTCSVIRCNANTVVHMQCSQNATLCYQSVFVFIRTLWYHMYVTKCNTVLPISVRVYKMWYHMYVQNATLCYQCSVFVRYKMYATMHVYNTNHCCTQNAISVRYQSVRSCTQPCI